MEGRHLRTEDGVILAHLFGKYDFVDGGGLNRPFFVLFFFGADSRQKRADTDTRRAQVVDLVDLQAGIDLAASLKDLIYFICRYGVKSAAERVKLDQIQIVSCFHEVRRRVQAGMVHPLVVDPKRTFDLAEMGDGILCQYGDPVAVDQIRDSVMDLRVDVVGASCQNDTSSSCFFQIFQSFLAFFLHIFSHSREFLPCGVGRFLYFLGGNIFKYFHQAVCKDRLGSEGKERIAEINGRISEFVHIVLDVLRIGGDNGAVIMIYRIREFVPLIGNAGIEDELHAFFDQPAYMAVGQLGRITFRFAGDGFNTQLVNLPGGGGREHHLVFQLRKEGKPERIILEHIQDSGDTHLSSDCLIRRKRLIGKQPFIFVLVKIGYVIFVFLFADSPLAAVAADKLAAAGEFVDGQTAVVGTSAAVGHGGGIFQGVDLVDREHGSLFSLFIPFSGDKRGAERSHDAGDIRTDGVAVRDLLKAPENRVVIEGSALYHDMPAKLGGVGNLDHLIERVLYYRIGKSGGDVGYFRALLLGLLYFGIHKYGASCSQVNGVLREKRGLREVLHAVVQRFGKSLDKGAASGRAGFVQLYAVDGLVLDLDAFHILSADIQNAVHLRVKEGGRIVVCDGFHLTLVQKERGLDQRLAVAGGTGVGDMSVIGKPGIDLLDGADRCL